jgi:hypothetical protein
LLQPARSKSGVKPCPVSLLVLKPLATLLSNSTLLFTTHSWHHPSSARGRLTRNLSLCNHRHQASTFLSTVLFVFGHTLSPTSRT